jgi:hypothetical protein
MGFWTPLTTGGAKIIAPESQRYIQNDTIRRWGCIGCFARIIFDFAEALSIEPKGFSDPVNMLF